MLLQIVTLDPARMARWQDDQTYGYTFAMDTLLDGRRTRSGGPDLLVAPAKVVAPLSRPRGSLQRCSVLLFAEAGGRSAVLSTRHGGFLMSVYGGFGRNQKEVQVKGIRKGVYFNHP